MTPEEQLEAAVRARGLFRGSRIEPEQHTEEWCPGFHRTTSSPIQERLDEALSETPPPQAIAHAWKDDLTPRSSSQLPDETEEDRDARRLVGLARVTSGMSWGGQLWSKKTAMNLESSGFSRCRVFTGRIVVSPAFDWMMCVFIILNAITMGMQTDSVAHTLDLEPPEAYAIIDKLFAMIFFTEIALRIFVFRHKFFYMPGWTWNIFDFVVVLLQILEEIISMVGSGTGMNISFTRVLKLLRLVRAIRIVRIARLIRELRTLVMSMTKSLKSLGWTCLLFLLIIYILSLFMTQAVSEYRRQQAGSIIVQTDDARYLDTRFGSVSATMFSLFAAISGGEDWSNLCMPMAREMSWVFVMVWVFYIGFSVFALMNVVTGIFVDSVLLSAKQDKEAFLVQNARDIFKDTTGTLDLQNFLDRVDTGPMQEFFKGIDVDSSQARRLFHLVDLDGSGAIDSEEFLSSCIRLNGPAKALDTAVLVQEVSRISSTVHRLETIAKKQKEHVQHRRVSAHAPTAKA